MYLYTNLERVLRLAPAAAAAVGPRVVGVDGHVRREERDQRHGSVRREVAQRVNPL